MMKKVLFVIEYYSVKYGGVKLKGRNKKLKIALIAIVLLIAIPFAAFKLQGISLVKSSENNELSETADSEEEKSLKENKTSAEDKKKDKSEEKEKSEEEKVSQRVTFMGVGDNLIHDNVYRDALQDDGTYDFKPMYEKVGDLISEKDIAYIDQETIIGGDEFGLSGYPVFNTPEDMAPNVKDVGFDIVNIANNHVLDKGPQGIINTREIWDQQGLTVDGAFATEEQSREIPVIEKNGMKIAFLCYTYGTNGIIPDTDWRVRYFDEENIRRDIEEAKKISDFILVSAHWGDENFIGKTEYQENYANLFNELGVDVVLGTHPHVIGPVEEKVNADGEKTLVIYSTGNFLSAMYDRDNMLGYTATFDFVNENGEKRIENIKMIPTVTYYEFTPRGTWGISKYINWTTIQMNWDTVI